MLPWFLCGYISSVVAALPFYDILPVEVVATSYSVSNAGYLADLSYTSRVYCHHETNCYLEYAECWVESGSFGPSWIQTPIKCKTTVSCRDSGLAPEDCCHA